MPTLRKLILSTSAVCATALASAGVAAAAEPTSAVVTIVAHPTKVLTILEENHSFTQMKAGMPYLWSQAQAYGYATTTAIRHPSLPNYLGIVGGSTFGVTDDKPPSGHPINATTVFDQAVAAGKTAKVYAESMISNCSLVNQTTSTGSYAVRHNPWTYFTPSRTRCGAGNVPAGTVSTGIFMQDARNNALPNAGMLIPNLCNDAHDCTLAVADNWLKARLPTILASNDFLTGQLAVVITADEGNYSSSTNEVLTVVLHVNLHGKVVATKLTRYSLTRF